MRLVCGLLGLFQLVLLVRAVLSWFPVRGDGPVAQIQRFVHQVTEPVLAPIRRLLPLPGGGFDITFLLVFFVLSLLRTRLGCGAIGV